MGVAAAMPRPDDAPAYGPPAPVYKPAPAPYKPAPAYGPPHKEEKLPPQPYQFEYGVADQYTGTNFQAVENQNAEGTVIGKTEFLPISTNFYHLLPIFTNFYYLAIFTNLEQFRPV